MTYSFLHPYKKHSFYSISFFCKKADKRLDAEEISAIFLLCFYAKVLEFDRNGFAFKSTIMRKSAKGFNISGWLFFSLVAKSKVPIHTYYLPH